MAAQRQQGPGRCGTGCQARPLLQAVLIWQRRQDGFYLFSFPERLSDVTAWKQCVLDYLCPARTQASLEEGVILGSLSALPRAGGPRLPGEQGTKAWLLRPVVCLPASYPHPSAKSTCAPASCPHAPLMPELGLGRGGQNEGLWGKFFQDEAARGLTLTWAHTGSRGGEELAGPCQHALNSMG